MYCTQHASLFSYLFSSLHPTTQCPEPICTPKSPLCYMAAASAFKAPTQHLSKPPPPPPHIIRNVHHPQGAGGGEEGEKLMNTMGIGSPTPPLESTPKKSCAYEVVVTFTSSTPPHPTFLFWTSQPSSYEYGCEKRRKRNCHANPHVQKRE